jgi:hypothetical protein
LLTSLADKYSQIYRILLPICNALSQIPALASKPALQSYIDNEFGSTDNLISEILGDFFRHGFDGSGADSFFDAGSCIDVSFSFPTKHFQFGWLMMTLLYPGEIDQCLELVFDPGEEEVLPCIFADW